MARILRGDIWWADFEPIKGHEQGGVRPVLVISEDIFNEHSGTVIALAITSQHPKTVFPLVYKLPDELLPKPSWVKISQIRTLSTERLSTRAGSLKPQFLISILEGLNEILGYNTLL